MRLALLILAMLIGVGLTLAAKATAPGRVADTVHNLSAAGPGRIKALDEKEICVFCHGTHGASAQTPLWNRGVAAGSFLGASPRGAAGAGAGRGLAQATGSTKLCLSCHDGTLALGGLRNRPREVEMRGTTGGRMPQGAPANLGRDLSGSHPVSFQVTPELVARRRGDTHLLPIDRMRSDRDVRLDAHDRLQCTTCHDPHSDANYEQSGVRFLRKPDLSDVCLVCHDL